MTTAVIICGAARGMIAQVSLSVASCRCDGLCTWDPERQVSWVCGVFHPSMQTAQICCFFVRRWCVHASENITEGLKVSCSLADAKEPRKGNTLNESTFARVVSEQDTQNFVSYVAEFLIPKERLDVHVLHFLLFQPKCHSDIHTVYFYNLCISISKGLFVSAHHCFVRWQANNKKRVQAERRSKTKSTVAMLILVGTGTIW